jgi:class 3 adenylate cyclase/pimeloyl-ACP methyl ester carboxylesterase
VDGGNVEYAENDGVSIAYQVFGQGPRDLVFVCGTMSHLELWWADPLATAMLQGLARFSRVILFDKPGTGLSDPVPAAPTAEQRTSDVVAVMDAARSRRAVVVGYSEGGCPAMMLAATQPERVEALVLLATMAATEWHEDMGVDRSAYDAFWAVLDEASARWGRGTLMSAFAPTLASSPVRRLLPSIERACMSPAMARSVLQGMHGIDLRATAAAIHVPTLVAHAPETFVAQAFGRDVADRIPGAKLVALQGPDHLPWIHNSELFPALIEQFLTGAEPAPPDERRVMTTIVFTDIVESTRQLSALGDAAWQGVVTEHDRRMNALLIRYDGEHVKHTGDGRMARFNRPGRALRFAVAMRDEARELGLQLRAGVHTGECDLVDGDVFGMTVNIAARVAATARPDTVLTSSTVRDLVIGSALSFGSTGMHDLKGVPGRWELLECHGDAHGAAGAPAYETDVRHEPGDGDAARPLRPMDRAVLLSARRAPRTTRRVLGRLRGQRS